jgi:hypothetical protein
MVPVEKGNDHPTLEGVRELFDRWRQGKKRRAPIPPALWKAAVSLTDAYSIHKVARFLHLNHSALKSRVDHANPIAFVEINAVAVTTECTVEIERPTGEKMRITASCSVTDLVRLFLG